ncbi:MAG: ABC transporter substrate-binding protein [Bacteroidia bacterium]|nr:ABC transporter substrate-binding protein [Bacteroidia bacterium]
MQQKRTFTDDLGRQVEIEFPPRRIISLCPSQTETLIRLPLPGQVVGRTRFCIHPRPEVESVPRVGGTKEIKFDLIRELQPDLIIGEKEENTREMILELEKEFPVFLTDVVDIPSALRMIRTLGRICGAETGVNQVADEIEREFARLKPLQNPLRTSYFIWREPWMVAGNHTFIQSVLETCGFENVCLSLEGRYPEISLNQLQELDPQLILLSSEPYPFREKHLQELQNLLPQAKIQLVDGEMFSWYGIRMLQMPPYLNQLLDRLESL